MRLAYGQTLDQPTSQQRVKIRRQFTQLTEILSKAKRSDGQIRFIARLIHDLDKRIQKKIMPL